MRRKKADILDTICPKCTGRFGKFKYCAVVLRVGAEVQER